MSDRTENFMLAGEIQKLQIVDDKIELVLQNGDPAESTISLLLDRNDYNYKGANELAECLNYHGYKKGDWIQVSFLKVIKK